MKEIMVPGKSYFALSGLRFYDTHTQGCALGFYISRFQR